jgi:hypothetical protein
MALLTLAEAALLACEQTREASGQEIPVKELNEMAALLSRVATVMSMSPHKTTMKSLSVADLRGGQFADGGRTVTFQDGRPPLGGLVMRRSAFALAMNIIKEAGMLKAAK